MSNYIVTFTNVSFPPSAETTDLTYEEFKVQNVGRKSKGFVYLFIQNEEDGTVQVYTSVAEEDGSLRDNPRSKDYLRLATRSQLASAFTSITSPRKAASSRENGKKGGRRKQSDLEENMEVQATA